jgi:hypothetical protein
MKGLISKGRVVGKLKTDFIKHEANRQINSLLKNQWLDEGTVRAFIKRQTELQSMPFILNSLVDSIRIFIDERKKRYGT